MAAHQEDAAVTTEEAKAGLQSEQSRENNSGGQQRNACRKRGVYETSLVCRTHGWHQRLSKTPAKHMPVISVWFLSSLGALQLPKVVQVCVGRMSLLHCFTPKWGLPSLSLLVPDLSFI